MARPPEPLEEVLGEVSLVVTGRVTAVLGPGKGRPAGPHEAPSQLVELEVERVWFDPGHTTRAGARLAVSKPAGDYALAEGHHGPFILRPADEGLEIVGRYGPDTYPIEAIVAALDAG